MKVGFIGIGAMGLPMAKNVLKSYPLEIYNRSKSKCKELLDKGATWSVSPKNLGKNTDIIIIMLSDNEACENIILGSEGIIESENNELLIINMTTLSPKTSIRIATSLANKSIRYLEAPVSGTIGPARDGTLTILCAGEKLVFEETQPILKTMGNKIYYIGEYGSASKIKLLINANLALQTAILAETLSTADHLNISKDAFLEIVNNSAVATIISKMKGKNMIQDEFPSQFALKHMIKDLKYASGMADDKGLSTPLISLTKELYLIGANKLSNQDFSAILKIYTDKIQNSH